MGRSRKDFMYVHVTLHEATVKDDRKQITNEGNNFFDLAAGLSCVGN